MDGLRWLAVVGVASVVAGWAVGWFERFPIEVGAQAETVRPSDLSEGALAWVFGVPVVLAPFVPFQRHWLVLAWPAVLPALCGLTVALVAKPRDVVGDVPIGVVIRDRTLGQALTLVGLLFVLMALTTAWRRAPDWDEPSRWRPPPTEV